MTPQPEQRGLLGELRTELLGRPRELACFGGLAFLVLFSYELARPAAESLFLEEYGNTRLPWAWLAVALTMAAVVAATNRLMAARGVLVTFVTSSLASAGLLVSLLLLLEAEVAGVSFALYVWKDVYVVLLIEAFWITANSVFRTGAARWLYGAFCAAGSLGAMSGGLVGGGIARSVGTATLLWLVPPLLLLAAGQALLVRRLLGDAIAPPSRRRARFGDAARILRHSRYLLLMVLLIATTQAAITFIDYEYSGAVAAAFPEIDARTQVMNWVYLAINGLALLLQIFTGALLRLAGVAAVLVAVPLLLGSTMAAYILMPLFAFMLAAKVASKALDYSLFRAAKELLYIPLSPREKSEGKAVVDMLTYRAAKGAVSPLLGLLVLTGVAVGPLTLGLLGVWLGLIVSIVRRYRCLRGEKAQPAIVTAGTAA